jgi:hypothetical protein
MAGEGAMLEGEGPDVGPIAPALASIELLLELEIIVVKM